MTVYPTCAARRLLIDTPSGKRVSFNQLMAQLYKSGDAAAWYSQATNLTMDEHGLLPADAERFLELLPVPATPARQMSFFEDA